MATEDKNYMDNGSVILSKELTAQIFAEIGAKAEVDDLQGFLQVVVFRPDDSTLLGIDGRAEFDQCQEEREVKFLTAHTMATIFNSGSCSITTVINGNRWDIIGADSLCPPHKH